MARHPTYLGTVQDVQGATIRVALAPDTRSGLVFIDGRSYRIGQVGSFVRVSIGLTDLFGIVSQVGAGAAPEGQAEVTPEGFRWMKIQLIGEGRRGRQFERGVSQYPAIGEEVHLVTERDLARIYGRPELPSFVAVGSLASADSIPALVNVDALVTRHSAVLGATGSGKSTTVARLLFQLSDRSRFPSARIMVLDIHGEYSAALREHAAVFRIGPDPTRGERPLYIPYWAMTFDELLEVTLGSLGDAERGAVMEKIVELKLRSITDETLPGVSQADLTVDSPVPFSIHKLWFDLHRLVYATHTTSGGQSTDTEALVLSEQGEPVRPGDPMAVVAPLYRPQTQAKDEEKIYLSNSPLNLRRSLDALASKLRDPRFDFLFRPGDWLPNAEGTPSADLDTLMEAWLGGQHPVTILDLSGIPVSVLTHLIGVLLRVVFDCLFWARNLSEGGKERPLLIVLEEAHSYLSPQGSGIAAASARRVVKEGRKYGIGAMVVSQRPSEVDATVLSQCGTLFAMRLPNPADRAQVTGTASDNLEGLFSMLPSLRIGEAIIVGEAVHLPMRALIAAPPAERMPDSRDPVIYGENVPGGWNREREPSNYREVVEVWRRQNPKSTRVVN